MNLEEIDIPDAIADQFKGCGHAIASLDRDGELLEIVYMRDLDPAYEGEGLDFQLDLSTPAAIEVVDRLSARGPVIGGMCSGWTFMPLLWVRGETEDRQRSLASASVHSTSPTEAAPTFATAGHVGAR